ncbi:MAG: glycosyltransferase [Pyrinomonadaceae bacterium]
MGAITDVTDHAKVRAFVTVDNRLIGSLDIFNQYQPISESRLREAIANKLTDKLVEPLLMRYYALGAGNSEQKAQLEKLSEKVSASVVVATRDRPSFLRECLRHLVAQVSPREIEIIVVDNNPDSGLTLPVVAEFPQVALIEERRPGLSYARNKGIASSRGEIVVATDDDVVMPPQWLEKLVAPFAADDVMIVTGNVLPLELDTTAQQLFEVYGGLGRGFDTLAVGKTWFNQFKSAVPTWNLGATANAAFRARIFSDPAIGLFDETLGAGSPTGCSEDTYLFYKVLKAGYTLFYEPSAFVWHTHRREMDALRHQIYNYSKGHVAYHLLTFINDRDLRALVRLFIKLPQAHLYRSLKRMRGKSDYPLSLIMLEAAGNLVGPWSLWQSRRRVRREGRSQPYVPIEQRLMDGVETSPAAIIGGAGNKAAPQTPDKQSQAAWERSSQRELSFWEKYITKQGMEWKDDFLMRVDPQSSLQDGLIADYINDLPENSISLLDVGAGPLTIVGKSYPGKQLRITAVDPLAEEYNRILKDNDILPPVRTVPGRGETLPELFASGSFDLVFARSVLDRCHDPVRVIKNMLAVIKERGYVLLQHKRNEAQRSDYRGIPLWNIDFQQNSFVIWNRDAAHNITEIHRDDAEIDCYNDDEWLYCVISKHGHRKKISEAAHVPDQTNQKTLVTGWFSFERMGATAGDLLARDVACEWLAGAGQSYDVALAAPFRGGVDWREVDPQSYSHVVFVCGPFGNGGPIKRLLRRFANCRIIGLDLSMLEPLDQWNPFDALWERDSSVAARPDISFHSRAAKVPIVGVVLVDPQPEYKGKGMHETANKAIKQLVDSRELSAVAIDTRLDLNRTGLRTASEVESLISRMDVVLTTRLHGLVLALKNGVPVIAVDPVAGGAKIKRQADTVGWPLVFTADALAADALQQAFDYCLTEEARVRARQCGERAAQAIEQVGREFISIYVDQ